MAFEPEILIIQKVEANGSLRHRTRYDNNRNSNFRFSSCIRIFQIFPIFNHITKNVKLNIGRGPWGKKDTRPYSTQKTVLVPLGGKSFFENHQLKPSPWKSSSRAVNQNRENVAGEHKIRFLWLNNQGQMGFMNVFIDTWLSCTVRPTNSLCRQESDALLKVVISKVDEFWVV